MADEDWELPDFDRVEEEPEKDKGDVPEEPECGKEEGEGPSKQCSGLESLTAPEVMERFEKIFIDAFIDPGEVNLRKLGGSMVSFADEFELLGEDIDKATEWVDDAWKDGRTWQSKQVKTPKGLRIPIRQIINKGIPGKKSVEVAAPPSRPQSSEGPFKVSSFEWPGSIRELTRKRDDDALSQSSHRSDHDIQRSKAGAIRSRGEPVPPWTHDAELSNYPGSISTGGESSPPARSTWAKRAEPPSATAEGAALKIQRVSQAATGEGSEAGIKKDWVRRAEPPPEGSVLKFQPRSQAPTESQALPWDSKGGDEKARQNQNSRANLAASLASGSIPPAKSAARAVPGGQAADERDRRSINCAIAHLDHLKYLERCGYEASIRNEVRGEKADDKLLHILRPTRPGTGENHVRMFNRFLEYRTVVLRVDKSSGRSGFEGKEDPDMFGSQLIQPSEIFDWTEDMIKSELGKNSPMRALQCLGYYGGLLGIDELINLSRLPAANSLAKSYKDANFKPPERAEIYPVKLVDTMESVVCDPNEDPFDRLVCGRLRMCVGSSTRHDDQKNTAPNTLECILDESRLLRGVRGYASITKTRSRHWVVSAKSVSGNNPKWLQETLKLLKKAHSDRWSLDDHLGKACNTRTTQWLNKPPSHYSDTMHIRRILGDKGYSIDQLRSFRWHGAKNFMVTIAQVLNLPDRTILQQGGWAESGKSMLETYDREKTFKALKLQEQCIQHLWSEDGSVPLVVKVSEFQEVSPAEAKAPEGATEQSDSESDSDSDSSDDETMLVVNTSTGKIHLPKEASTVKGAGRCGVTVPASTCQILSGDTLGDSQSNWRPCMRCFTACSEAMICGRLCSAKHALGKQCKKLCVLDCKDDGSVDFSAGHRCASHAQIGNFKSG